jgi:hypothetical protein
MPYEAEVTNSNSHSPSCVDMSKKKKLKYIYIYIYIYSTRKFYMYYYFFFLKRNVNNKGNDLWGQVTVLQPPLCIKIMSFNAKMSFDVTSKDIFAIKFTCLIKRGSKGTGGRQTVPCISGLE